MLGLNSLSTLNEKIIGRVTTLLTVLIVAGCILMTNIFSSIAPMIQLNIHHADSWIYADLWVDQSLVEGKEAEDIETMEYSERVKADLEYLREFQKDGKIAMGLNGKNANWYSGYVCETNGDGACEISLIVRNIEDAGIILMNEEREIQIIEHIDYLFDGNVIDYDYESQTYQSHYAKILPFVILQLAVVCAAMIFKWVKEKFSIDLLFDGLSHLSCVLLMIFLMFQENINGSFIVKNYVFFVQIMIFVFLLPFGGYYLQSKRDTLAKSLPIFHVCLTLFVMCFI